MLLLIDGEPDPSQGLNLEDGTVHAQVVGPAPIGTEPAAEPNEDADPPDAVVDAQGRKLVPLEALHQTRQELKAAKALAAQVDELRQQAAHGADVEQQLETLRPLLVRLKSRPDIMAAVMAPPQAGPAMPPGYPVQQDPGEAILPKHDAEDLARTLELYTPEGAPDLLRARKLALFMRRTGGEEALRVTAPVTQNLAQGQAGTLRQQYATIKDKAGRTVNQQVLAQMFSIVPAELIAQEPNVAGVLYYAAKGYSAHHGMDDPVPQGRPPLVTEPSGGRGPAPSGTLSDLDRAMQKALQITDKQYTESSGRYKPGAINVLE